MKIMKQLSFILVICFFFMGCDFTEENSETHQVSFFLDGSPFTGSVLEVKTGYMIPTTNKTIRIHAGGKGLYRGSAEDVDKFWTISAGPDAGEIWEFKNPVTENITLTAASGTPPVRLNFSGKGKEFFDNAMNYINDRDNAGSYILALGENAGEEEDIGAGIKNKEINKVTFSPGVDLTLIGIGGEKIIHTRGSRVFVLPGDAAAPISLTLGKNITIMGSESSSNGGLIRVGDGLGGRMNITFTMLDGSKITGYYTDRPGGSGNPEFSVGSGVVVVYGSINMNMDSIKILFHMKGGEITGNHNYWNGGQASGGVTLNRARMIMEGDAKITGNTGFGGDIAYGVNSHWPMVDNLFVEIKDNATIGEIFLFSSVAGYNVIGPYYMPHVKIHNGWTGNIGKLNLGYGNLDGATAPSLPGFWVNNIFIRNAAETGSDVGTITAFLPGITLGGSFHWNSGRVWPDEYANYKINPATGTLIVN